MLVIRRIAVRFVLLPTALAGMLSAAIPVTTAGAATAYLTPTTATTATTSPTTPAAVQAEVRGVVVRVADDGAEHTALQVPGNGFVPIQGAPIEHVPSGSQVLASVAVPSAIIDAAREDTVVPADGGGNVRVDQAQLAEAHREGGAAAGSPLASASIASADAAGQALTAKNVTVLAASAQSYARAKHEVTVAVVTPKGVSGAPASQAKIRAQVANASAYWSEESRGGITFSVASISAPYTSAYPCGSDPFKVWEEAAQRVKFVQGPNRHLVLSFPTTAPSKGCPYGLASIGSGVNSGGVAIVSDSAWPVFAHELGHNFGLGHAQSLQCSRADVDLKKLPAGCSIVAYGNPWSIMARSAQDRAGALTTVQAARIGLLVAPDIVDVTRGSQTVTLNPVSSSTGLRAVRLTDPISGEQYFVEYRTRTGRDRLLYQNVPDGIRILKVDVTATDQRGSVVLDTTPTGSSSDYVRQLVVGKTFISRTGGISITTKTQGKTATVTASAGVAAGKKSRPAGGIAALGVPRLATAAVNATDALNASARVSWGGAPTGVRYDVRVRTVGADAAGRAVYGAPKAWLTGTARGSSMLAGSYGGVYQVSARMRSATDTGSWSGWKTTTFAVDAGAKGASFTGPWRTVRHSAYYAGTALFSSVNGAALQRSATAATNIKVTGTRHARGSIARVYVDGKLRTTVNTYAAHIARRQVLANIAVPPGKHVVRIVNVTSAAHAILVLDAVAYTR